MSTEKRKKIAIVGSGPAGLMAASVAARAGHEVVIFEKRRGPGRKLLIAGSSGLNITYDAPIDAFAAHYTGSASLRPFLEAFSPGDWIAFIEELGIPTFKGTSRRYFVEGMKGSALLRAWLARLAGLGVRIEYGRELADFEILPAGGVRLSFLAWDGSGKTEAEFDAACLGLGGGSYESEPGAPRWMALFAAKGIGVRRFEPSNVGYQVEWPEGLLREAEGKPVKNIVLRSSRASRSGDLVITKYGIEGTPIYFAGPGASAAPSGEGREGGQEEAPTVVFLDLKPDLTEAQVAAKLRMSRENLAPIRRIKRFLGLGEGALALLYHLTPAGELADLDAMIARVKRFPLRLERRQPLSEAISSSGGVDFGEVDGSLMLRDWPGVFVAGEMLDWDAPTGGFLIQACVSLGHAAGRGIVAWLTGRPTRPGEAS